jgi:hypothetical protein
MIMKEHPSKIYGLLSLKIAESGTISLVPAKKMYVNKHKRIFDDQATNKVQYDRLFFS